MQSLMKSRNQSKLEQRAAFSSVDNRSLTGTTKSVLGGSEFRSMQHLPVLSTSQMKKVTPIRPLNVFSTLKATSILTQNESTEISFEQSKAITPDNPSSVLISAKEKKGRQKQLPRLSKIIQEQQ